MSSKESSAEPQPGPSGTCGRDRGLDRRGAGPKRSWQPYYQRNWNRGPPREKPTTLQIPKPPANVENLLTTTTIPPSLADVAPVISFNIDDGPQEYPGWKLYIPKEKYDPASSTMRKIKATEGHFIRHKEIYDLTQIKTQFWFKTNLQIISKDNTFKEKWNTFLQDLNENPEYTLGYMGLAMHKLISSIPRCDIFSKESISNEHISSNNCLQSIRPRIHGYKPLISLQYLKENNYDRLLAIRGTVIRAGASELFCTWMAFKCSLCGAEQAILQPDGVMTVPSSCKTTFCRARSNFEPLLSSPFTRTEAFQVIRLQESMICEQYESGRVPRCIEVELTEDLVDSVCPGDDITVTGILKVRPQEEIQRKGHTNLCKMYIRAVAISSNKTLLNPKKSEFTEKDLEAIMLISKEPSPLKLLVQSLCPVIYGHEMVKAGLLLGLFGGSGGINRAGRRSEIHILMMGDPGIGKSQILQACANVAPRGIFVSGNSSSSAGLTVTVRREKGSIGGGGALEAGALVLADQGTCCIDELDKMANKHQSLLEVMEQQAVSVAQAGVLCSLQARTSILAAANPVDGHYDRSKTSTENLKMNAALLSRFDLTFILLDRPNKYLDSLLTKHIQALHSGHKKLPTEDTFMGRKEKERGSSTNHHTEVNPIRLEERLRIDPNDNIDLLPQILLQKYIAFARKHINPQLNIEAAQKIKQFYLELRSFRSGVDYLPVTTRQLEGLILLTQARARIDLSSEATIQHALDVLSIVRFTQIDLFGGTDGCFGDNDPARKKSRSGKSQISQIKQFLRVLQRRANSLEKTIFSVDELKEIASAVGVSIELNEILETLCLQGYIIKKGINLYKVLME